MSTERRPDQETQRQTDSGVWHQSESGVWARPAKDNSNDMWKSVALLFLGMIVSGAVFMVRGVVSRDEVTAMIAGDSHIVQLTQEVHDALPGLQHNQEEMSQSLQDIVIQLQKLSAKIGGEDIIVRHYNYDKKK